MRKKIRRLCSRQFIRKARTRTVYWSNRRREEEMFRNRDSRHRRTDNRNTTAAGLGWAPRNQRWNVTWTRLFNLAVKKLYCNILPHCYCYYCFGPVESILLFYSLSRFFLPFLIWLMLRDLRFTEMQTNLSIVILSVKPSEPNERCHTNKVIIIVGEIIAIIISIPQNKRRHFTTLYNFVFCSSERNLTWLSFSVSFSWQHWY